MNIQELEERVAVERVKLQRAASEDGIPVADISAMYKVLAEIELKEIDEFNALLREVFRELVGLIPNGEPSRKAVAVLDKFQEMGRQMRKTDSLALIREWLHSRKAVK